jgi:CO dehydrogenase maturation factor
MCGAHAAVRQLLAGMLEEEQVVALVDMEAGLEHLSRGTARHVDTLLVVLEPYDKALETARRCAELGRELGIPRVLGVANKLRGGEDRAAVRDYAAAHGLSLAADVPFDEEVYQADLAGRAPAATSEAPAARALETLAVALQLPGAPPCQ